MTFKATSPQQQTSLTGRRVLSMLIGFFGFIVVVNSIFIYFAVESWPGLSTNDAYRKGLAYNETLNAAQRQQALNWRSKAVFLPAQNNSRVLRIWLKDAQNQGLNNLHVSVELIRPTHEGVDQSAVLAAAGDGMYQTAVTLPLKGRWNVIIDARKGDLKYRMAHELMVK